MAKARNAGACKCLCAQLSFKLSFYKSLNCYCVRLSGHGVTCLPWVRTESGNGETNKQKKVGGNRATFCLFVCLFVYLFQGVSITLSPRECGLSRLVMHDFSVTFPLCLVVHLSRSGGLTNVRLSWDIYTGILYPAYRTVGEPIVCVQSTVYYELWIPKSQNLGGSSQRSITWSTFCMRMLIPHSSSKQLSKLDSIFENI